MVGERQPLPYGQPATLAQVFAVCLLPHGTLGLAGEVGVHVVVQIDGVARHNTSLDKDHVMSDDAGSLRSRLNGQRAPHERMLIILKYSDLRRHWTWSVHLLGLGRHQWFDT